MTDNLMKRHKLSGWLSVALIFLSNVACTRSTMNFYSFFYDFGSEGMVPDLEYTFHPFEDKEDDNKGNMYSYTLVVRFNDSCKITDLPLEIEKGSLESDSIQTFDILVPLFDPSGRVSGKGNYSIYETMVPLKKDSPYEEGLFFSVSTKETETKGLLSLGIYCEIQKQQMR